MEGRLDSPEQPAAGNGQGERFGLAYLAAVVAIVVIMPVEFHGRYPYYNVLAVGLVPAVLAWLIVRKRPARQGLAAFRGASLVLALVGLGGLGLLAVAEQTSGMTRETIENGRFPIQAGAYLVAGFLGLAGSFLFGQDDE
jgi:glucan phosphoethanolaminetransferase (alkaline phosphatase superfamily)